MLTESVPGARHAGAGIPGLLVVLLVLGCSMEAATVHADEADSDGDGVVDLADNCPAAANADQADVDGDGWGDACDNCVEAPNPLQESSDPDAFGDACDNCPFRWNQDQADRDGDGHGDRCDLCPDLPDDGIDEDRDGIGDACDPIIDQDDDGITSADDNCPDDWNPEQEDLDDDGVGDACDNCRVFPNPGQETITGNPPGVACALGYGDVAPRGEPDGVIDIADVVQVLRYSVLLDEPDALELARSDVAPANVHGLVRVGVWIDGTESIAGAQVNVIHPERLVLFRIGTTGPILRMFLSTASMPEPWLLTLAAAGLEEIEFRAPSGAWGVYFEYEHGTPRRGDFAVEEGSCDLTDADGWPIPGVRCYIGEYDVLEAIATPRPVEGERRVDIADVLLMLRASIGLVELDRAR